MKVVVTAEGPDLESAVDSRFGRAKYFILVDTDSDEFTAHSNEQNLNSPQGAGIQAGQAVSRLGAEAVLTGHVGPKAFVTLQAAKVAVYPGVSGTVKQAIEVFKLGQMKATDNADVEGHWA